MRIYHVVANAMLRDSLPLLALRLVTRARARARASMSGTLGLTLNLYIIVADTSIASHRGVDQDSI